LLWCAPSPGPIQHSHVGPQRDRPYADRLYRIFREPDRRSVLLCHARWTLVYAGLLYVIMRFLFPRVLLMPVMVTAGVLYVALCLARIRVVLDRAGGALGLPVAAAVEIRQGCPSAAQRAVWYPVELV